MPQPPDAWTEISVEVAGIDSETVADVFRQVCPGGAVIEPSHRLDPEIDAYVVDGDGPAIVRGYAPADADIDRIKRGLRLALQHAPLQAPPRWRRPRRLHEADWRNAWKKHFGLQRIGQALVIRPSWVEYRLKEGETVIRLDPGMAFGTGQHPTTAMCLRAIEQRLRPGMNVLDLGCGSGILSIAAAKLGAARVLALDTDPQAIKATIENALANETSHLIEVRESTLGSPDQARQPPGVRLSNGPGLDPATSTATRRTSDKAKTPQPDGHGAATAPRSARPEAPVEPALSAQQPKGRAAEPRPDDERPSFNLIAANISGLALQRLAPGLAAALLPDGALIASGFLEDAVPGLRRAFENCGLGVDEVIQEGVWRALVATRPT